MGLRSLRLEHVKPEPVSIGKSTEAIELTAFHYSYKGGQKQRVAIEIILFDEPTSGLDVRHMLQVSEILKKLKTMGKTVVIITHDPELILRTCDYIVHLDNGIALLRTVFAADSGQNVNGIPSPKRIGGDNRYVFDNRLCDNQPVKRVLMM